MWVESDTNIPSGESIVRQIIFGKNFWIKEFEQDITILWLPDTFGFSGSLPQIMKKSGISALVTMKLSWNRVNRFPYHSFWWEGIDGSRVLVHMLPEGTYNSPALPQSVIRIEREYREREVSDHALMVYGIGDGGGGPGAEHLERLKRMNADEGFLHVKQEKVGSFLKKLQDESSGFPVWEGELYLERHQGTFSTQGKSKLYNKQMETMLYKAEFLSVIAMVFMDIPYPKEKIDSLWKEILLYQFHDILPGTSIKRVYDESWEHYRRMLKEGDKIVGKILAGLPFLSSKRSAAGNTVLSNRKSFSYGNIFAFNFLPWKTEKWVESKDGWVKITVPAMGFALQTLNKERKLFPELKQSGEKMENDLLIVTFGDNGSICSIYDKREGYEIIQREKPGNLFSVYSDQGDAWDFPVEYREKRESVTLVERESIINGPYLSITQRFAYRKSSILQEIHVALGSKRIDFKTKIEWHETGTMLRVSFPVELPEGRAFCGSAFGAVERPINNTTSWEKAKDEIPVQGWADISNSRYGASLISPSKYGYRVKENVLDLCLLRSVPFPGSPLLNQGYTDLGHHECSYSFLPHTGNYRTGKVVTNALNVKYPVLVTLITDPELKKLEKREIKKSFFEISENRVVISSVKQAESARGIIVRLYESSGLPTKTLLKVHPHIFSLYPEVSEVTLLEAFERVIPCRGYSVKLNFTPYEIKTILFAPKEN